MCTSNYTLLTEELGRTRGMFLAWFKMSKMSGLKVWFPDKAGFPSLLEIFPFLGFISHSIEDECCLKMPDNLIILVLEDN